MFGDTSVIVYPKGSFTLLFPLGQTCVDQFSGHMTSTAGRIIKALYKCFDIKIHVLQVISYANTANRPTWGSLWDQHSHGGTHIEPIDLLCWCKHAPLMHLSLLVMLYKSAICCLSSAQREQEEQRESEVEKERHQKAEYTFEWLHTQVQHRDSPFPLVFVGLCNMNN